MGTITGLGDLDPIRWPNSHWRSLKVVLSHRLELVDAWWFWLCTFLTLPISHVVYVKNSLGLNDPLILKHITCDSTITMVLPLH